MEIIETLKQHTWQQQSGFPSPFFIPFILICFHNRNVFVDVFPVKVETFVWLPRWNGLVANVEVSKTRAEDEVFKKFHAADAAVDLGEPEASTGFPPKKDVKRRLLGKHSCLKRITVAKKEELTSNSRVKCRFSLCKMWSNSSVAELTFFSWRASSRLHLWGSSRVFVFYLCRRFNRAGSR